MDELKTTTSTLEQFQEQFSALKQNYYNRVHYVQATREEVFPQPTEQTERLLASLTANKLTPEFYRVLFTHGDGHEDVWVCLIKNCKYAISFTIDYGAVIHLRQLYRHKYRHQLTNYKARQILRKFERICGTVGFQAIMLEPQATRLSERLPHASKGFECDDVPEQEDLIRFYSKLGYKYPEEEDVFMVRWL